MKKHLLTLVAAGVSLAAAFAVQAKDVKVASPNGRIVVEITDKNGELSYSTSLEGRAVYTQTGLEMKLKGKTLGENAKISGVKTAAVDETLNLVVPMKQSEVHNNYTEATLTMKGGWKVAFRVFDNAVAYRYILNEKDSVYVVSETFNLKPAEPMDVHFQPTRSWGSASESPYRNCKLGEWKFEEDMAVLPIALSSQTDDLQLLISESDLDDYPGLYLRGKGNRECLSGHLVPYYEEWDIHPRRYRHTDIVKLADYAAHTSGKRSFPWRYVVIGDSKELLEQTITAQLAGPCELDDTSWIEPGLVSWDWWNYKTIYGPDVNFEPGCNTATYKYFIDFAAKYGIKYIIMDEGWQIATENPFKSNAKLDLHECIRYGKEKGVGIILWLTWCASDHNFDTLFAEYEKWGIKGVKIDFMDRQDQWMINWYERTAKKAAEHHLVVDFHGAMKPAGLEIRYPNVLAYEGILGLEQRGNCNPDNTLYIPFIRIAVGPADFTPGAMITMQPEYLHHSRANVTGHGTRAYNMALFTIMETGTQMLADSPTHYYQNHECTEYLSKIPCVWDETIALDAKIGEYLAIAKRSGDKWYLAGICNGKEGGRELKLSLDFLGEGNHKITLVKDGYNAGLQAMDYKMETFEVNADTVLDVKMVRNGGFTAIIE